MMMNELIEYLEYETTRTINRRKFKQHMKQYEIDITKVFYSFMCMNQLAKEQLLMIYNKLDIWRK